MIKNKKIVTKMKEYYPLNPKTKFRIEWLMPSYYTTVMFLFKNDIDPSVMEDIRLDKELELTYFCLEIEPCMMWMKFMKPLKSR
jgi:hypothetical protein